MISWLSTGTTVLQIYHKFLNHVSLALTMEVLLSTCFVTPRFKFFTLTVSVDYYVKKKKKKDILNVITFLFYIVQSVYFYESYFFV